MNQEKIARINALAKKSKTTEGLTAAEQAEQKALREEYLADFRRSFRAQLANTDFSVQEVDGTIRPILPKNPGPRS